MADDDGAAKKEQDKNACVKACNDAFDECMKKAGSDMEKAVCNTKLSNCLVECS